MLLKWRFGNGGNQCFFAISRFRQFAAADGKVFSAVWRFGDLATPPLASSPKHQGVVFVDVGRGWVRGAEAQIAGLQLSTEKFFRQFGRKNRKSRMGLLSCTEASIAEKEVQKVYI